jgi:hypothetical protein
MAVDKTEPPIKVILTVAGLSLGILVTLRVFFVSYFNNSYETRSREHIDAMLRGGSYLSTAGRVRTEEARLLGRLQASMDEISRGQRPGSVSPTASTDIAPLTGWTLTPREVPRAQPALAPSAPAAAPPVTAPVAIAPVAVAPVAPTSAPAVPAVGAH